MRRPLPVSSSLLILLLVWGCGKELDSTDYKQYMRDFVQGISAYARNVHPGFSIVPQNGPEILTADGTESGKPVAGYVAAIDGVGREDLFYGYGGDDLPTPTESRDHMLAFADLARSSGLQVLTTDYCSTPPRMDDSYALNAGHKFISLSADSRELDRVPAYPARPFHVNDSAVTTLLQAKNFLYLIAPDVNYVTKADFVSAIDASEYDLLIIDAFFGGEPLAPADLEELKTKPGGAPRLVIAYMSIGEAEDYRFYWQESWRKNPPAWLAGENPAWPGNYKVRYWDPAWQAVIYGNPGAYLDRIIAAGFDGAYLDIIEAFEYFESSGKWWKPY